MAISSPADLIVIGAGPGGYVAAIRAAQLGMKVIVVEKRATLGGTCLNVGCIPSKALLNSSEKYAEIASGGLEKYGITLGRPKLDLAAMMKSKDDVVSSLTTGIDHLFRKNKITRIEGLATITAPGEVKVTRGDKTEMLKTERILIATGSEPSSLPDVVIDEKKIVSSTGALELTSVPKKLVLIGAGYIGLEMGTVWRRLGAEVEVVEYLPRILPGMDSELARKFKTILEKQGISFRLSTAVKAAKANKSGVVLDIEPAEGGDREKLTADIVLVAVGRKPNTEGLGLEEIGLLLDDRGRIPVDEDFETVIPGIFAIGDVIPGPMLAHKAEEDGVAAVEIMAGLAGHVDYDHVPGIVYTAPEIATLGKSEDQLKEAGIAYNKGVFPLQANSRARAVGHGEGFVKILADKATDKVLGVHIIGHEAGTVIHECATAMAFGASSEDIARTCHGHPTLNEAVKEAALAVDGRAIHI
ncbi:dihydrolipoyl dehydrogenase [Alphaproteobacteria bacterium LSUCC0684]